MRRMMALFSSVDIAASLHCKTTVPTYFGRVTPSASEETCILHRAVGTHLDSTRNLTAGKHHRDWLPTILPYGLAPAPGIQPSGDRGDRQEGGPDRDQPTADRAKQQPGQADRQPDRLAVGEQWEARI